MKQFKLIPPAIPLVITPFITAVALASPLSRVALGFDQSPEPQPITPAVSSSASYIAQTIQEPSKEPQFRVIETIPPSPAKQFEVLSNGNPKAQAEQIESGLKQANHTGEIGKYSSAGLAIQRMLQRMRWGESAEFASRQTGVSQETVLRLLALGTEKPVREDPRAIANALVRGLSVANATGEIGYTAPLSYRIQDVVRRLRRGNALANAQRYSGISQKTINRLLELGNYRPES